MLTTTCSVQPEYPNPSQSIIVPPDSLLTSVVLIEHCRVRPSAGFSQQESSTASYGENIKIQILIYGGEEPLAL